ncbi:MAG: TonB-dependent receptor plug domain-containing protein [Prevotella sp.]|nr:TonB-dependent receptor plug domain-containing protein [Prevotella sp.]
MKRLGTLAMTCVLCLIATAQSKLDSVQHVREIVVVSRPAMREVVPSQKLNGEMLEKLNTHSVADALRYFSGIQLKDYGGVGGIKTVNIRSMGTHHLGISYDGVQLGNAQNGQIDLGQFSLDNVEEITLYNGQKSAIFQPASDFGNAGAIYIRTKAPDFSMHNAQCTMHNAQCTMHNYHLKFKAQYGSSDMFRFSTLWEQKLSETVSSSVSAGFLTASGKYKFRYERRYPNGETAWDTTAVRQNGDIHAERIEANLFGRLDQGGWQVKGYLYHSARGIPGAIVNNVWRRGERQQDLNTFVQAAFDKNIGNGFSTRWLAKYAYYNTHYVNKDSTQLPVDNRYKQQEFYLSTANVLELLPNWSASLSYDFKWNKLNADTYNFAFPTRLSNLVSLATAVDYKHLKAQGSVLATFIHDKTNHGSHSLSKLTPALFVNIYPFRGTFFSMRAYVKKSFRMPTFNDLYYTDMGNANLVPESALQYDAGFALNKHFENGIIRHAEMHFDAYYNTVHDKIVAYPKGQQFRWTMLNLGKVHIKGIDVEAEADCSVGCGVTATLRAQYTYQDARDVTDPQDSYYNDQIPYIPWHSGSAILGLSYKNWDLNYSFIYAGERYDEQENILYNHMEPWYTSDLSLRYQCTMLNAQCTIMLDVNNILDQDYEVIVNYPMPGRNYAVTLSVNI